MSSRALGGNARPSSTTPPHTIFGPDLSSFWRVFRGLLDRQFWFVLSPRMTWMRRVALARASFAQGSPGLGVHAMRIGQKIAEILSAAQRRGTP